MCRYGILANSLTELKIFESANTKLSTHTVLTDNPSVYSYCLKNELKVTFLSSLVSKSDLKLIDKKAEDISIKFRKGIRIAVIESLLRNQIYRSTYSYLYKSVQLSKLLKLDFDTIKILSITNRETQVEGDILPDRFHSLYLEIIQFLSKADKFVIVEDDFQIQKHTKLKFESSNLFTKFLSVFDNGLSVLLFKICDNFVGRKLIESISSYKSSKPTTVFIYKENDYIQENWLRLLGGGWTIRYLRCLKFPHSNKKVTGKQGTNAFQVSKVKLCKVVSGNILDYYIAKAFVDLVSSKIGKTVDLYAESLAQRCDDLKDQLSSFNSGDMLLCNVLNSPDERLLNHVAKSLGVKVISVQHGLSFSRSKAGRLAGELSGYGLSDFGLYYNLSEEKIMQNFHPHQTSFVTGVPNCLIARVSVWRRMISRALAGISIFSNKKIIIYVARVEGGNFKYGYSPTDFDYYESNYNLISRLCEEFFNSIVILKLYPSTRFLDVYDYEELAEKYTNLKMIRSVDFRYLRHCADFILTASNQSTLSWAAGTLGASVYFIDDPCAQSFIDGFYVEGNQAVDFQSSGGFLDESYLELTSRDCPMSLNDILKQIDDI